MRLRRDTGLAYLVAYSSILWLLLIGVPRTIAYCLLLLADTVSTLIAWIKNGKLYKAEILSRPEDAWYLPYYWIRVMPYFILLSLVSLSVVILWITSPKGSQNALFNDPPILIDIIFAATALFDIIYFVIEALRAKRQRKLDALAKRVEENPSLLYRRAHDTVAAEKKIPMEEAKGMLHNDLLEAWSRKTRRWELKRQHKKQLKEQLPPSDAPLVNESKLKDDTLLNP